MIEIKSESGEDDGSGVQDAASTAAAEVPTAQAHAHASGTETSDVMAESSDQGETDREDRAATPAAGLSPAAAAVPAAAPAPAVESPRVSSRAKPLVDMFEDQT